MKTTRFSRREFLAVSAGAGLTLAAPRGARAAGEPAALKTTLHKAVIRGLPDEATLTPLKAAGFEGIECNNWNADPAKAEAARGVAERMGMRIHSVLRGWTQFNDPKVVDEHVRTVETALHTASILGADAILLVPCRIGGMPMPNPADFRITFDPDSGRLTQVVEGDNAPYAAYIKAHDEATAASRAAVERLIPAAEKEGVVIALENVWNNLWVKPDLFAAFVGGFKSKWVRAYFDIGNHVKYAPPQDWIRTLGPLIAKCHVKDFKLNPDGRGGKFVDIRDGSVDWPLVRRTLDEIGYNGWMTIEGSGGLAIEEQNRRLDLIVNGQ